MKKSILIINIILISNISFGQNNVRNGLWSEFSTAKNDTTKVLLLAKLGDVFNTDPTPDSAFIICQRGVKLAESIGYIKGKMKCKKSIARVSQWLGDFETTIQIGYEILAYANTTKDSSLLADGYDELADGYGDAGHYTESIKWALKSFDMAIAFGDSSYAAVWLGSIGFSYYSMGKYQSAIVYLTKALSYPQPWGFGAISTWMAQTQTKLNNYDTAFYYYHQSIDDLSKENNSKDLAAAYTGLASLYLKLGNTESCIYYSNKALSFAQPRGFRKEVLDAYLVLSSVYEKKNTGDALRYYKLATKAKDSLYTTEKQNQITSYKFNEELRQKEIMAEELKLKNSIRTYILLGIVGFFLIFMVALIRNNKQKQKAKRKIEKAYSDLKSTQSQLIQSEKMASLGELTAGIAHEIQNPLNFVNNFSEVSNELIDEMKTELDKGDINEAKAIANDVKQNLEKINHHGKRADAIVKGMLQHSRSSSGVKEPTDINALCDEYLRLSYHGLRAKDKSFNATMKTDFDNSIGKISILPQDIGRVILNLLTNAFYVVDEKKTLRHFDKLSAGLAQGDTHYEPTVSISTKKVNGKVEIRVTDNGNGIPQKVLDKIFQPFFTTKPTGQGTGLGLSLSYDIITKGHGGELKVETKEGEGSTFTIQLPIA